VTHSTIEPAAGWLPYEQVHGKRHTVTGTVWVWPSLVSRELSHVREILVYVPPSLAAHVPGQQPASADRYPVIYFHDGQNMFDTHTSYVGEWCADETLEKLAADGLEVIAVAIPNAGDERLDEYSPWRGKTGYRERRSAGRGDAYMEWLVDSVKTLVDRSFPTRLDRAGTGTMGSSLGGLIALYAAVKYPELFGFIGAMSPSVRWHNSKIAELYEEWPVSRPRPRIYMDMGGREWRGAFAEVRELRDVLEAHGWVEGMDLSHVEDRYGRHHEESWARRLPDALRFMLAEAIPGLADQPAEPKPAA
jgi:predicted alpha/beta superfamily hydrolase